MKKVTLTMILAIFAFNNSRSQEIISNDLQVNGEIKTQKGLVLDWNNGRTSWFGNDGFSHLLNTDQNGTYPFNSRGNLVIQSRATDNHDIVFGTGATPSVRAVIKGNGNIGIGTNNPESKLSIVSNIDPSPIIRTSTVNSGDQASLYFHVTTA